MLNANRSAVGQAINDDEISCSVLGLVVYAGGGSS